MLKFDEKCNQVDVTPYETGDFENCCFNVGLTDMKSTWYFYSWTNTTGSREIDRATSNDVWVQSRIYSITEFLLSGCLSDHFPCIVPLLQQDDNKVKPFRFLNIWM